MSGYSDGPNYQPRPPSDPSGQAPYPSQPQHPEQSSTNGQGATIIVPPQSSDRPRQTFSTFSIREPNGQSYTPRTGATSSSAAGSTPPTGPNSDPNRQNDQGRPQSHSGYPTGFPPAIPGFDHSSSRPRTGPYDPYETPNQYGGPAPSGPNFDSRSGLPPIPSDYPRRTDYIRSHAASPQPGGASGNGDAKPTPPRGPAAQEAAAGRTEQLREVPTGPSGKSRAPNGANSPRPIPTAPAQSSQPSAQTSAASPAAPQSVDADDDITELSSLAKLRQFKASIATKRSKQAHDVDSDAVAEMAASFSAPASAVPPTPSTLGLTTGPSQTDAAASDAGSDAAAINKAREQELKERLKSKALKQEGGASPDVGKARTAKHRMEDGEIADEEAKRARLELMPTSAGTTDESQLTGSTDSNDPMRSAGKRKRAAEWMKTTSASQEPVAEPVAQEEKKPEVASSPVVPPRERSLMDRVGQQDTSKRERQTSPGDRAKPHKMDLKARARSRSPTKTSRAPAPGSKDPNWSKKPTHDEKPRSKAEPERDSKPSLAERIGPSFAKDGPRRPIDPDILDAPLGSRDRKDSIRSRPGGYHTDFHRRSRSPQRQPASRPYEPDNRSSISARDRPDYRPRDRELSPYSARQRSPVRDSFRRYDNGNMGRADRDDRDRVDRRSGYQRDSIGGYQDLAPSRDAAPHKASAPAKSAPAPAAPAPPTEAVMETLAVLKAQISALEAGLPGAQSAAPAPAPAPAPQSRYPPAPPALTRQAPPASSYPPDNRGGYGGDRYDRPPRPEYDRPPSPRGASRLAPPSAPPISAYDRARPISPGPLPIPLHAFTRAGASPVRYDRPLPPRYDDQRDAPQDYGRDDRSYRGPPPRGYDGPPPAGPPVRNSYDAVPRDYLPPSTTGAGYGGSNYRPPPPRDPSPPPNRPYSNNYAPRVEVAPPPRTEYRERYDPASRPGPPPQRYGSPVPSTYGGGAYSHPADNRPDYDSRYPPGPPPQRRTGGFDNRAASAGSARGGAYAARRGGYEGSVGGRSEPGDRDRERDMRDRDYERDREREREMRERDRRDYDDRGGGDFGGRGGYRGDGGRGGSSLRGRV